MESSVSPLPQFIANDSRYKKERCWCGCPPSGSADTAPDISGDRYNKEHIEGIECHMTSDFKFLNKQFDELTDGEKITLKLNFLISLHSQRDKSFSKYKLENLTRVILYRPTLITLRQFLELMGWTLKTHSMEMYIIFEECLNHVWHYYDDLLSPIKLLVEEYGLDVNHNFIDRHMPDEDHPEGKIFYSTHPLTEALFRNMPFEVCHYLFLRGANPEAETKFVGNIFSVCFRNSDPRNLEFFSRYRHLDEFPDPFVHVYQFDAHVRCIPTFAKAKELGYDMNYTIEDKLSGLSNMFCTSRGNDESDYEKYIIFKWLIENGTDINHQIRIINKDNGLVNGMTLIHIICMAPFDYYTHPLVKDHILSYDRVNWWIRDSIGMLPVEYLIDWHMGFPRGSDTFSSCMVPNFLCGVILNTGLKSITDCHLPNYNDGDDDNVDFVNDGFIEKSIRVNFALTILYLKYISPDCHDNLKKMICNELCKYYRPKSGDSPSNHILLKVKDVVENSHHP